jgi:hypothetical protein
MKTSDLLIECPAENIAGKNVWRTISEKVFVGQIDVGDKQKTVSKSWVSSISKWGIDPGEVDAVSSKVLAAHPVDDVLIADALEWFSERGLMISPESSGLTVMQCRAVGFHQDIACYGDKLFAIVWLGEQPGLDLFFPHINVRVPLNMGTVVIFDSGQPHGVLGREFIYYNEEAHSGVQVNNFLSFEFEANQRSTASVMNYQLLENCNNWRGKIAVMPHGMTQNVCKESGYWS